MTKRDILPLLIVVRCCRQAAAVRYGVSTVITEPPPSLNPDDPVHAKQGARSRGRSSARRVPPAERITVALVPAAEDHLRRLQERTSLSKTDLANRAITLYEFFDAQLAAGGELIVRDKRTGEDMTRRRGPAEMPTSAAELKIILTPARAVGAPLLHTGLSRSGHVFISYVSEDSKTVDRLQRSLEKAGIIVWRDRSSLGGGDLWKSSIREAIASGAFFVACFSAASKNRSKSYMNEELTLAVEEMRMRNRERVWFLPVVLPGGEVPDRSIGAGESLRDFNYIVLSAETWSTAVRKLVQVIEKGLA